MSELNISAATRWLLISEINNEIEGGDKPTTLRSSLESVRSGYSPDDRLDMKKVEAELLSLIEQQGESKLAEELVDELDWSEYWSNNLEAAAIDELNE